MRFSRTKAVFGLAIAIGAGLATYTQVSGQPAAPPARFDADGHALPEGATARLGTLLMRHGAARIAHVAYLDNARQLLTVANDGYTRIWDAATGKELRSFGPSKDPVKKFKPEGDFAYQVSGTMIAALSEDGKHLATGNYEGTLTVWDVAEGKALRQMRSAQPNYGFSGLAFVAKGKQLLTRDVHNVIRLWDAAEGKQLHQFGEDPNKAKVKELKERYNSAGPNIGMTLSADGKNVVTASMRFADNKIHTEVRRWDVVSGKELAPTEAPVNGYKWVCFHADGKTCAWGSTKGTIHIWDVESGKEVRELDGAKDNYGVQASFSADGKVLATYGSDHAVRLWTVADGKEVRKIGGAPAPNLGGNHQSMYLLTNLALSTDGSRAAGGSSSGVLRQWDVGTGKEIVVGTGHRGPVVAIALAPDGKTVHTYANDHAVITWDITTKKPIHTVELPPNATHVALAASAEVAAVGHHDSTLSVWDLKTGKESRQWKPAAPVEGRPGNFSALVISPDGKWIASRTYDQVIRIWDAATGKETQQIAEQAPAANGATIGFIGSGYGYPTLGFSPDGTTLLSLAGPVRGDENRRREFMPTNNVVRLWDVSTGRLVRRFDQSTNAILSFAFAPDGRTIATSCMDNTIHLWETASGKVRLQTKTPTPGNVGLVQFSPDGKTLASTGQGYDPLVRCWDVSSGKELTTNFKGHSHMVGSLAFAGDGKALLTGGGDTTALLWDTTALLKARTTPAIELTEPQLEAAWADLASTDAKKAYEAARLMIGATKQSTTLLQKQLRPVPAVDEKLIAQLVADLDHPKFANRQKANEELEKLGELAVPALKAALEGGPALEIRMRIDRLLEKATTGQAPPPEELRALRAIEVLEHIGTPEAKQALEGIAKGAAGAQLTRQAKTTLDRMLK